MSDDAHANAAEAAVAREARLSRIEDDLKKLKPKGKDGWEIASGNHSAPSRSPAGGGQLFPHRLSQ